MARWMRAGPGGLGVLGDGVSRGGVRSDAFDLPAHELPIEASEHGRVGPVDDNEVELRSVERRASAVELAGSSRALLAASGATPDGLHIHRTLLGRDNGYSVVCTAAVLSPRTRCRRRTSQSRSQAWLTAPASPPWLRSSSSPSDFPPCGERLLPYKTPVVRRPVPYVPSATAGTETSPHRPRPAALSRAQLAAGVTARWHPTVAVSR
jgi:hypothetical protein